MSCLLCGATELGIVLDLGHTGLANNLPAREDREGEPLFPLRLARCSKCTHVQLADRVAPKLLYAHYLYVSSASSTLERHLGSLAAAIASRIRPGHDAASLDIGCNDGTLAAHMSRHGFRALGIDPADNLAPLSRAKGVEVEVDYFGRESARRLFDRHGPMRVITATNSFPHIPDLASYLDGVASLLATGGIFVIEAHYLLDLVEQCAFDTIYHEHCHFWRLEPMMELFARHGLEVFDCERLSIHHGQLRVWVQHLGARTVSPRVAVQLAAERKAGLASRNVYDDLARRAVAIRADLCTTLSRLKAQGKRIAGYGAPAKASTLAAWCGLGPDDLLWIADRNPLKQGRFTPGTHIPIVDPARIDAENPEILLLLAWNFADEIQIQLSGYRERGGQFLIPVPEVRLV
ncbi:MAG TPA: class I SAM-dependent methyltransferase [Bryobacteraceae bacterium]|nr:class I SAM-dependent methyltransferase [Bryobacteraceae bacterium]